MARTGERTAEGQAAVADLSVTTKALATLGTKVKDVFSSEDVEHIFNTVARACRDPRDRWLYLAKCAAHGLSPVKNELFAVMRRGKNKRTGEEYQTLTFVTSYHVFVSRARQAGFVVEGEAVCENDEWKGWETREKRPVSHVIHARERGAVIGAYATATHLQTGRVVGGYWSADEVVSDSLTHKTMPEHMAKKVAICRVARMVAPDLSSLYAGIEFGVENPEATWEATPDAAPEVAVEAEASEGEKAEPEVLISNDERRELTEALRAAGYKKPADALAFLSSALDRSVSGTAELTPIELEKVRKVLAGEVTNGG